MIGNSRWPYRPDVARLDWVIMLLAVIAVELAILIWRLA